jgi:hypothetical protein
VVFRSGAARRNLLTHRPSGRLRRRLTQALGGITNVIVKQEKKMPSYTETNYGYLKDERDQTCTYCGAVFHVVVPGQSA